ncbi:MAG: CPBP family intramembrane glutamic endopeptidase [Rickettsiales bacterium]
MITTLLRRPQVEFFLIFFTVPLIITLSHPKSWIYSVLWFFALLAWRMLHIHYKQGFREEWNIAALNKKELKRIFLRFIPFAIALAIFTWIVAPERFLDLPTNKPLVWLSVIALYPLLSVFPQEIIYRSYFFKRYMVWPADDLHRYLLNCFAFGWIHIVLQNWVAVVFSAIGSLIFTHTYLKTRSLAAVCFEHALYGCYVFTIGLGYYFYHGAAH